MWTITINNRAPVTLDTEEVGWESLVSAINANPELNGWLTAEWTNSPRAMMLSNPTSGNVRVKMVNDQWTQEWEEIWGGSLDGNPTAHQSVSEDGVYELTFCLSPDGGSITCVPTGVVYTPTTGGPPLAGVLCFQSDRFGPDDTLTSRPLLSYETGVPELDSCELLLPNNVAHVCLLGAVYDWITSEERTDANYYNFDFLRACFLDISLPISLSVTIQDQIFYERPWDSPQSERFPIPSTGLITLEVVGRDDDPQQVSDSITIVPCPSALPTGVVDLYAGQMSDLGSPPQITCCGCYPSSLEIPDVVHTVDTPSATFSLSYSVLTDGLLSDVQTITGIPGVFDDLDPTKLYVRETVIQAIQLIPEFSEMSRGGGLSRWNTYYGTLSGGDGSADSESSPRERVRVNFLLGDGDPQTDLVRIAFKRNVSITSCGLQDFPGV